MEQYLQKIEKNKNYGIKIYQQIKSLIINGNLKAGSAINEREYAAMLGVSRTPLRDALTLLEREGWIEQNGKTRVVSPLLWKDILELLEIREAIDTLGFKLAFPKCSAEDFAHLHGIVQEMMDITVQDNRSYYNIMALDTRFHRYINRKSGNSMLITFSENINEKVTRASVLSMKYSGEDGNYFAQEHLSILQAMEERDYDCASQLLSEHYAVWEKRMLSLPNLIGFDPTELDTQIQEEFVKSSKQPAISLDDI